MARIKRIFSLFLAAAMVLALLASCGNIPDSSTWAIENGVLIVPEGVTRVTKQQIDKITEPFTAVSFPSTLTYIGESAFEGNTNLRRISFATEPEEEGLASVAGLISFATMPAAIGLPVPEKTVARLLTNSRMLSLMTVLATIGTPKHEGCTVGDSAFARCIYLQEVDGWICITKIENSAFMETALAGALDLSEVEEIGDAAFKNCDGITGILNLFNADIIGAEAFAGCNHLDGVYISPITRVAETAFLTAVPIHIANSSEEVEEIINETATNTGGGGGGTATTEPEQPTVEPEEPVDTTTTVPTEAEITAVEAKVRERLTLSRYKNPDKDSSASTSALKNQLAILTNGTISSNIESYFNNPGSLDPTFQTTYLDPFYTTTYLSGSGDNVNTTVYETYSTVHVLSGDMTGDQVANQISSINLPTIDIPPATDDSSSENGESTVIYNYQPYAFCYVDYAGTSTETGAWVVYLASYYVGNPSLEGTTAGTINRLPITN